MLDSILPYLRLRAIPKSAFGAMNVVTSLDLCFQESEDRIAMNKYPEELEIKVAAALYELDKSNPLKAGAIAKI
ncbi:hypothetical protein AXFE_15280 [Acidithrix ferrooxidans]|uniref:Uncharacterized protein n=1 Tax=Acidithrix ferrooxidans TaxID=1280514 RepID=A0A0D8HI78_9ACTN|nr:hypothetical protein AXFE_15280 [Acidithrix ferrooxidans]